jgi:uncharacterized protein YcbK (DUF882 family)
MFLEQLQGLFGCFFERQCFLSAVKRFLMSKACLLFISILSWGFCPPDAHAQTLQRFFFMGDGQVAINGQTILFRRPNGAYDDEGLQKLHRIFGADWEDREERLSLRFLEMLDYLQDRLKGGSYALKSGYRNPAFNRSLRDRGKLAAQSSMHMEGAAADLVLAGVPANRVFEFVKELNCCGIGWYHGAHFHLDTGPARFWDETTSKTEDKTPQQNEKIILQPEMDRYLPGERVGLVWMRATEYPFGVPSEAELIKTDAPEFRRKIGILFPEGPEETDGCRILSGRKQARSLAANLPGDLKPGIYAFRVRFCNRFHYERMPEEIVSRSFEIQPGAAAPRK